MTLQLPGPGGEAPQGANPPLPCYLSGHAPHCQLGVPFRCSRPVALGTGVDDDMGKGHVQGQALLLGAISSLLHSSEGAVPDSAPCSSSTKDTLWAVHFQSDNETQRNSHGRPRGTSSWAPAGSVGWIHISF